MGMVSQPGPMGRLGFRVWGSRPYCDLRLVGGNHYEKSYIALHEGVPCVSTGVRSRETAELVHEPWNPNDRNAVSVYVRGLLVGYMSRADASHFGPLIGVIRAAGYAATCDIRLWFRVSKVDKYIEIPNKWWMPDDPDEPRTVHVAVDGETMPSYSCGAALALGDNCALYPVNSHPRGDYFMLPPGRVIPVYDLNENVTPLRQLRTISADSNSRSIAAFATLTVGTDGKRERAVVNVDGMPIGRLSLPASKDFVPLIKSKLSTCDELAVELHFEEGRIYLNCLRAFELNLSAVPSSELFRWHENLPFVSNIDLQQYPGRFVHKVWSEEAGDYVLADGPTKEQP
jgi:hypothetical protein